MKRKGRQTLDMISREFTAVSAYLCNITFMESTVNVYGPCGKIKSLVCVENTSFPITYIICKEKKNSKMTQCSEDLQII